MAGGLVGGRRDKNNTAAAAQSVRRSRIAIAIAIGFTLGCFLASLNPHGFLSSKQAFHFQGRRLTKSFLQIRSFSCESSEQVIIPKSDLADLSSKNEDLKKQVLDLTEKLMAAEQKLISKSEQQQVVVFGEPQKAGAFGTVKGIRTNPVVLPDDTVNPKLAEILKRVAVKNEVIVVFANSDVKPMLEVWFTSIKKVDIPNYLVVALDDGIVDFCRANDIPFYQKSYKRPADEGVDSIVPSTCHHAIKLLKFKFLREFLQLGYSVLVSDVDIVYIQNPFDHIYRDSDVEAMSNGHSYMTVYGYNDISDDPSMGWGRFANTMHIWAYNSGFFYIRPTLPAIELLDRVADRISDRDPTSWYQAVFNEELFVPSHPRYVGLHASKRTMDHFMFMNSKTLFKQVRKDGNLKKLKPVIVHVNYHPDKLQRMKAVMEFYVNGKQDALEPFTDGSDW